MLVQQAMRKDSKCDCTSRRATQEIADSPRLFHISAIDTTMQAQTNMEAMYNQPAKSWGSAITWTI